MRVNYEKLGVHKEKNLKVDYTKLAATPMPKAGRIKADYGLLGVKRLPDDPSYHDLLTKNLDTVLKEISSWRVPMQRPSFKWIYAMVPAVGAICLCLIVTFSGASSAVPTVQPATIAELSTETDTKITYISSQNTQTVNVGQLTRTAEEMSPVEDQGVLVSVLPAEELTQYMAETDTASLLEGLDLIVSEETTEDLDENTFIEQDGYEQDSEEEAGEGNGDTEEEIEEESEEKSDEESDEEEPADDESEEETEEPVEEEEPEPEIVMASVSSLLNVRTEPSPDAELAGALYADSGATVLEHQDGWTKIESGNLVGWASDEWLLTGEEAAAKLEEAGYPVVEVETSKLNVRSEPSQDADVLGHIAMGDEVEITETDDEEWAEIEFNGKTAYINTNYLTVKLMYNTGDTVDEMKEKAEEKAKAAAEASPKKTNTVEAELSVGEAYDGSASELEMLATIIYCEAGNQPYEGKVAVGNVVLNRMASASFPNDMNSVIRAPRQFSPVSSGKYDRMLNSGRIPESCYEAAQDAMSGISFVGNCLYFKNPKIAGAHSGITIQDHVFW